MAEPNHPRPRRRRASPARGRSASARHALMVIDHERLQAAAWAEFHTARKRMEKATRDLHRHEEVDTPAYQQWLHQTFPTLVTQLRELQSEALAKAAKIQAVQMRAAYFGGSPKRIWREQRERELHPERFAEDPEDAPEDEPQTHARGKGPEQRREDFEPRAAASVDARTIYRRLVQRLHPDRGGKWTAERERLWHEVQRAWEAGDADWLARLEVDWEAAHDVIGPKSPLSRLRRAIAELNAARRDTERKLRAYRGEPAWRFTAAEKKRPTLHRRIEHEFITEIAFLRVQLEHLNRTIQAWEDDWTRADGRVRHRRRHH